MALEEIEQLFRDYVRLAWNEKDDDAFERMIATEIEVTGFAPEGSVTRSRDELWAGRVEYFRMFPDIQYQVDRVMVDGKEFMVWLTGSGTAQPDCFGLDMEPTYVTFDAAVWGKVVDGRIVSGKNLIDFSAIREALIKKGRTVF